MRFHYKLFTVILLLLGFWGISWAGGVADSLRLEKEKGQYYVIHRVEPGETLYSLSRRYQAEVSRVIALNQIQNNQLSVGQELRIPIQWQEPISQPATTTVHHTVATGETLFSLSRKYGITVQQLREWNNLAGNEISIGQELIVSPPTATKVEPRPPVEQPKEEEIVKEEVEEPRATQTPVRQAGKNGFIEYQVQTGDLLERIALKFQVLPDSIVVWNNLRSTYLAIGQKLLIRGHADSAALVSGPRISNTPYGKTWTVTDQSGFTKIFEEGVASKIESSSETDKYLALHRTLKVGTLIEVRNLMNNQKIFVRVVGKLPETGLNENVLVRLTPICFQRLGIIDPKTRVEVSYYQEP